jgi:type 1 glutamine amidotransferase
MKNILLVTAGIFHPPWIARLRLERLLAAQTGYALSRAASFERLPGKSRLTDYQAVVVYLHRQETSESALSAFDCYVSSGGGVLAIHSATASFKRTPRYCEILGGRFTGHAAIRPFEITPAESAGPFAGLPAFTVRDELYLHELNPAVDVHFTAQENGDRIPVVWTYRYGAGKVCYCSPGHRSATLNHPVYRQVLVRGLEWVID